MERPHQNIIDAIAGEDFEQVKYIVERGFDVNTDLGYGYTPLVLAIDSSNFNIIAYLVERGADVNAIGPYGFNPIRTALDEGRPDVVKYLMEHGANWTGNRSNPIIMNIIRTETNKLKTELTQRYLALLKGTPTMTFADVGEKRVFPKSLLLKQVYEVPYQELCSDISSRYPPLRLIALANILKLEYDINISWVNLCGRVKQALYLML